MRKEPLNNVNAILTYIAAEEQKNRRVDGLHLTQAEFNALRVDVGSPFPPMGAVWVDSTAQVATIFGIPIYIDEDPFLRMAREYLENA